MEYEYEWFEVLCPTEGLETQPGPDWKLHSIQPWAYNVSMDFCPITRQQRQGPLYAVRGWNVIWERRRESEVSDD